MTADERTPVLVGVGQVLNRIQDLDEALEPLDMMMSAIELAERDTHAPGFLHHCDSVRVVRGMWSYQNPAKYIAEAIGANHAETVGTLIGGNQNQAVINETSSQIQNGELDLVLIAGAENGNSAAKARRSGRTLPQTEAPGSYDRIIGAEQQPEHHPFEVRKGIRRAIQVYPMYDNAIRFHRNESIPEHLDRVSALWSRFNDVAQRNPNAWVQHDMSAKEIRTPTESNRPISFPYTKFMNANMSVNMGASLIVASIRKAKELGIPDSRWVYPLAGVQGYDHFSASVRDEFFRSPGIRIVGERLMELADTTAAELEYVDLYSCFPSAVQLAAREYGLSEDRDLTVTGGLTFGGGPLNNYVMHSIARMVVLLRGSGDAKDLITANGGNIYKQAHGVYGSEPLERPFVAESVQDRIDAVPERKCLESFEGSATIEAYTVMYDGFQPSVGHVACRNGDDARIWVNTDDSDTVQAMTSEEFCGRPVRISNDSMRLLN